MDNKVNKWTEEVVDNYKKRYLDKLNSNTNEMITHFGFIGDIENNEDVLRFLNEKKYQLKIVDVNSTTQIVYLIDKEENTLAYFGIKSWINRECMSYEFTDIIIRGD